MVTYSHNEKGKNLDLKRHCLYTLSNLMEADISLFKITSAIKQCTNNMQHWPQSLANHTKDKLTLLKFVLLEFFIFVRTAVIANTLSHKIIT